MSDIRHPEHDSLVTLVVPSNGGYILTTTSELDTANSPSTRKEALQQDREGWLEAERNEISNHTRNGSWTLIPFSELPHGRKLIRFVWAYKIKRSGKKKARLCVQGSGMIHGTDYDPVQPSELHHYES